MELYIKVENGQIIDHPMLRENLAQAFPNLDFNNLPEWLVKFERVPAPPMGPYEKNQYSTYIFSGDIVTEIWSAETMTPDEILEKQNNLKDFWKVHGFPSWTFDETQCIFVAPVQYPDDGNLYEWNENTLTWDQI